MWAVEGDGGEVGECRVIDGEWEEVASAGAGDAQWGKALKLGMTRKRE